jgi:hypothetical protein
VRREIGLKKELHGEKEAKSMYRLFRVREQLGFADGGID